MNKDLLKWLPLLAAGGYFGWAKFVQKYNTVQTVVISLVVGAAASIPYFTWQGGVMPASAMETSSSSASLASGDSASTGPTRQEMINYMLDYDERTSAHIAMGQLPGEDVRRAAYNTLTNDELKVLYLFDVITDSKAGDATTGDNDTLYMQVAQSKGVDLSGLTDISQLVTVAVAKVLKAEKNLTQ